LIGAKVQGKSYPVRRGPSGFNTRMPGVSDSISAAAGGITAKPRLRTL
jgi:hypothetical protein